MGWEEAVRPSVCLSGAAVKFLGESQLLKWSCQQAPALLAPGRLHWEGVFGLLPLPGCCPVPVPNDEDARPPGEPNRDRRIHFTGTTKRPSEIN